MGAMGAKRLLMVEKAEGPTEVSAEEEVVITMIQGAEGVVIQAVQLIIANLAEGVDPSMRM